MGESREVLATYKFSSDEAAIAAERQCDRAGEYWGTGRLGYGLSDRVHITSAGKDQALHAAILAAHGGVPE